jgi:hypothetical protein
MSMYGGHGYWGYTGSFTVQGPTDTGVDDPVRIDGGSYVPFNLGMGMQTIQVNASFPVIPDKLDGYLAAGWYQGDDSLPTRDDSIGYDLLAMGKYMFGSGLNLEFGVDYAAMDDGHHANVLFNESRNLVLLFSRLQLEF